MNFHLRRLVPAFISLLISMAAFSIVLALRTAGAWQYLELKSFDVMSSLAPAAKTVDVPVVIVGMNEKDIRALTYPITDETLAKLIEKIEAFHPSAIGIDIYRDRSDPEKSPGGKQLAEVLTREKNVVAIMLASADNRVAPPPALAHSPDQFGTNEFPQDPDGVVRRGIISEDVGDDTFLAFAIQLANRYLESHGTWTADEVDALREEFGKLHNEAVALREKTTADKRELTAEEKAAQAQRLDRMLGIKVTLWHLEKWTELVPPFFANEGLYIRGDERGHQFLLDFKGAPRIKTLSVSDVLSADDPASRDTLSYDFKGKVVLIGVTAVSTKDFVDIPLKHNEYGINLHALIVDQLVGTAMGTRHPIRSWGVSSQWKWVIAWALLGGVVAFSIHSPWRYLLALLAGSAALVGVAFALFCAGIWVPVAAPAVAWVTSALLVTSYISSQEKSQRRILMQLFSKHISSDIVESIWSRRDEILTRGRMRGRRIIATVLFTDLAGFTTQSESREPGEVLDWLNEYMEAVSDVVSRHHGVVISYAGDSIMAVFGAPIPSTTPEAQKEDAANAVRCALAMRTELAALNARWRGRGLPTTAMRIGIHTGPAMAGSLGGVKHVEYSVIGDTTNTASRLQSFDRERMEPAICLEDCRILIGQPTLEFLDSKFETRPIGSITFKGKQTSVDVHAVLR